MEQTPDSNKKRNIKPKHIIWGAIFVLILAFIITGICTDCFGLYGPMSKIAIAGAKTFQTQNLSADFKISSGKFYAEGTLQLCIDIENKNVEAYIQASSGKNIYIAAIYNQKLIYGTQKLLFSKDIQPQIARLFQSENGKEPKLRSLDDAFDLLFNLIPDELQEQINNKYLNLDQTKELLKSFVFKKLNRTQWLKKHAGYDTYKIEGVRYHTFHSDKGVVLSHVVEHFEPVFVSKSLLDRLLQTAESMQKTNSSTETLIAIEDGLLTKYETIAHTPEKTSYISVKFHHIGTTDLDQAYLSELLGRAKS